MLHLKTSPLGYEIPIQKVQEILYDRLRKKWPELGETNFEVYGTVYRNLTANGYIAEVFDVRTRKEYKEVFFHDRLGCLIFFGLGQNVDHNLSTGFANVEVHVCVFVDMSIVDKDITHRYDYVLRKEVFDILKTGSYGLRLAANNTEVIGAERVLAEYDGLKKQQCFIDFDMQPKHCFRFNMVLNYAP